MIMVFYTMRHRTSRINQKERISMNAYDRKWAEQTAQTINRPLVRDGERIEIILEGLNKTEGYCPCVPKFARNEDTQCPCKNVRNGGACHCGIFDMPSVQSDTPK